MQTRPNENLGKWFHYLSKDTSMGGRVSIPDDWNLWPENWKRVEYKEYKNAKVVKLLPLSDCGLGNGLTETLLRRRTSRDYVRTLHQITLKELSCFIGNSIAESGRSIAGADAVGGFVGNFRVYPSGGGRYPLEFYFLIKRSTDLELGLYHYNVKGHCMEFLIPLEKFNLEDLRMYSYEWAEDAAVNVFVASVFDRTFRKYGERGYRYIFLEAGHVGQNFYLAATALGLKCGALAGVMDKNIEKMLYLDGERESVVYSFLLG